jgi:hypothetical protein
MVRRRAVGNWTKVKEDGFVLSSSERYIEVYMPRATRWMDEQVNEQVLMRKRESPPYREIRPKQQVRRLW